MRKPSVLQHALYLLAALAILTGCNMPRSATQQTTPNITQAYQTVQARLTQSAQGSPSAATTAPATLATPSPAAATPTLSTAAPSATPRPTTVPPTSAVKVCDQAAAGSPLDVTIPDGTRMTPGQTFTKTWRLYNNGTCTWTTDYTIALFSGEQMESPAGINLPKTVAPGESVDISVELTAPDTASTYRGNWKLRNAAGTWFGIGPGGASPFWVEIVVAGTPTAGTITPTATGGAATAYPAGSTPGSGVSASGQLKPSDLIDLDTGALNGAGADLYYKQNAQGKLNLAAQGSASIAVMAFKQPSYAECKGADLASASVALKDLTGGQYLCYKTDQGNYGWLYLANLDVNSNQLGVQFNTWLTP